MSTESPGSPLSSIASDDLSEVKVEADRETPSRRHSRMHPNKRRKTGNSAYDRHTPLSSALEENLRPASPATSVSSDTSGEVPNSPSTMLLGGPAPDEDFGKEYDQVTVCRWEGCDIGDCGNMDELVAHIHEDHIGTRQKKYACEWEDCARKGMPHASGYALRAHMRSHTREKPFFCQLPECDRSFTRSDALAKHMRTVHETEALRPSDPVPKNHNPPNHNGNTPNQNNLRRIKITMGGKGTNGLNPDLPTVPADQPGNVDMDSLPLDLPPWPSDLQFSASELTLPPSQLFRLLRRQLHWAEQEREVLRTQMQELEQKRRDEWRGAQILVDDVLSKGTDLVREQMWKGDSTSVGVGLDGKFKVNAGESDVAQERMATSVSRSGSPAPVN